jgi:hypothetical protein
VERTQRNRVRHCIDKESIPPWAQWDPINSRDNAITSTGPEPTRPQLSNSPILGCLGPFQLTSSSLATYSSETCSTNLQVAATGKNTRKWRPPLVRSRNPSGPLVPSRVSPSVPILKIYVTTLALSAMLFRHCSAGDARVGSLQHLGTERRKRQVSVIRALACVHSLRSSHLCRRIQTPGLKIASSPISGYQQVLRQKEDGLCLCSSVS